MQIGNTVACVRTARGTAAIGSIEICGPDALNIIKQIFQLASESTSFEEGQIVYGRFIENGQVIDDGIIGVEGSDQFALHCHGNPLILQQILTLLQNRSVQIITLEEMLDRRYTEETANTIEAEAQLESLKVVSLLGVQIIQNQIPSGLLKTVRQWIDSTDYQTIRRQAEEILQRSRIAERIIRGVRIVIAGPPNSGKSTLLNQLAGQQQALVSEIAGTTRDWVSAFGRIEPLYIEWIDTAGLDEELAGIDSLEQTAQQRTRNLLAGCDLILCILDATQPIPGKSFRPTGDIPVLTVLNKCDLQACIRMEDLPETERPALLISAKNGTGIEDLGRAVLQTLQVDEFDPALPVTFTARQKDLLHQIAGTNDLPAIKSCIGRLFQDPKRV